MELKKMQPIANSLSGDIANFIRKNLQQFDNEIRLFDVAFILVMASMYVLRIMYELNAADVLSIIRDAANSIQIDEKPESNNQ